MLVAVVLMLAAPVCAPNTLPAPQVQDVMLAIHTLWGAPVLIVIILGLLYQQLGWATFVGLVVVVIYSPVSSEWAVAGHVCVQVTGSTNSVKPCMAVSLAAAGLDRGVRLTRYQALSYYPAANAMCV